MKTMKPYLGYCVTALVAFGIGVAVVAIYHWESQPATM